MTLSLAQPVDELVAAMTAAPETSLADARVLIVDDDASAARLMLRRLERDGFRQVVSMCDGRRALDRMYEHPPDVLVLDVHMPHIDGFHLLRDMRHGGARAGAVTGVLAVSGDQSSATCQGMLSAGADDFLFRPFDGGEFALRVRRLASQTREMRRTLGYVFMLESRLRDLESA